MANVKLDLNQPTFQRNLLNLEDKDVLEFIRTLRRLTQMTWQQVYRDKGLNWEAIHSKQSSEGKRLYTIRISKKFRAVVARDEDFMAFLSLHPDHDSAY